MIITLPHVLRRIVILPELFEQRLQRDLRRIEYHQNGFSMTRPRSASLSIGRIWSRTPAVTYRGRIHAGHFPKDPLGTPEAAHSENDGLHLRMERWFH